MIGDIAATPAAMGPRLPGAIGRAANTLSAKPHNAEPRLPEGAAGDGAGRTQRPHQHIAPATGLTGTDTEMVMPIYPLLMPG